MPIDAAIPLGVKPPSSGGLASALGTANDALRLRSASQQLGANQAISNAYSQSIDPTTGQVDFAKLQALAAQNGAGAFLPQFMGQIAQQRNSQLQYDTGKIELAVKQQSDIRNRIGSLLSLPGLGKEDLSGPIVEQITQAVQTGSLPIDQAVQQLKGLPKDPSQQAQWIREHFLNSLSGEAKLQALMPKVQPVDTGGAVNIVPLNPMTGQPSGNITSFNKSLTPEASASRVPVFQNGQSGSVPLGSTVGNTTQSAQPGAVPSAPAAEGSTQSGFLPTAPVLGQAKIADAAADRYNSLVESANNAPTAINGYDRALTALAGAETSGKAADAKLFIPTILQSLGLQSEGGEVQNFQSLKKYLANAGTQAASAAGYSGSDARLASFTEGQPDPEHMNPGALKDAIQYVKALQTGIIAKNNAAQDWLQAHGGNTATLPQFEKQWSNAFSPDVMELRNLPQAEQQAYVAKLTPAKRKSLMDSYQKMAQVGAF